MALVQERNRLFEYPLERLAREIRAAGFQCTACGMCCLRGTGSPVSLLESDVAVIRSIDPGSLSPAPDPDFCDQAGVFYVSGYALRTKGDARGSCWFLDNNRCRIYDSRAAACRIYPYKLRREPETAGTVNWHQVAQYNSHGLYGQNIPEGDCLAIAREVKEYENAVLSREIAYLECIQEYFSRNSLRHSTGTYDEQISSLARGNPVRVRVFHEGCLYPVTWVYDTQAGRESDWA